VLANLRQVFRYRALISSLVARELKARYRGSVLGFLWTFANPLLLLGIYTFVFTVVMPGSRGGGGGGTRLEPYALFLLCGILPWTWFQTSLLESCTVLVAGGNLIRKVLFPAEILPIVTVLTGLVNFALSLVILAGFLLYYGRPVSAGELVWLPVIVLVQLAFTLGLSLLVSSLTVHFRDLRDLVANLTTLWFWGTPIIYSLSQAPERFHPLLALNPLTHLMVAYQSVLFLDGPFDDWRNLLWLGVGSLALLGLAYLVFDRLRDTLAEEV
jgi:ABC-type polysaccharide/polyol phosphate export permease